MPEFIELQTTAVSALQNDQLGWVFYDDEKLVDSRTLLESSKVTFAYPATAFHEQKLYKLGFHQIAADTNHLQLLIYDLNEPDRGWSFIKTELLGGANPALAVQGDGLKNQLFVFLNGVFKVDLKTGRSEKIPGLKIPSNTLHNRIVPLGNASLLLFSDDFQDQVKLVVVNTITESSTEINQNLQLPVDAVIGKTDGQYLLQSNSKVFKLKVLESSPGFTVLDYLVLVLYFVAMLWIGFYFSKKQKTGDDYFKAGGRIPWWAAGLSLLGTGLSAISFMAVPAKVFATDWAYYMLRLSTILMPVIVGLIYIPVFRGLDLTTAYEYLQKRFNLATRLIASLAFMLFQIGRIGIVLFLPAVALNVVTGFDVVTCIALMGVISLIYTMLGGIEAVIWTDVIQVFVLYGGIILCVGFIVMSLEGGIGEIISVGSNNKKFNILDFDFEWSSPNFWIVVFGSFFTNLTTYGSDQTMVQRYFTTKSTKDATRSIWTIVLIGFALGWLFFFMGTSLFAFYKDQPGEMLHSMSSNDAIFPWYIISQLPSGIAGLLIAGIFAAAMSSLSSSMNSGATAYTMDFHYLFKKDFDSLKVGRIVTFVFGLLGIFIAILFATLQVKSIWDEFLKIIGLFTGGLGGVFLLGLVTTRANGKGVLIGLLLSSVIQYFVGLYKPFNLLLFTASGFISCFVIGYLASFLFAKNNRDLKGMTVFTLDSEK